MSVITPKVWKALWNSLQLEFIPFLSKAQWADVAQDLRKIWNDFSPGF